MAIVIEEERESGASGGLVRTLVWVCIIGILVAAVYYIFLSRPDIVELALPRALRTTTDVSALTLQPETVINDPLFVELREDYSAMPEYPSVGRTNPFQPLPGGVILPEAGTSTTSTVPGMRPSR